jgi:hypothetical protein
MKSFPFNTPQMKKIILPAVLLFCFASFGQKRNPVPIIFDTDIAPDYDDVGAMALGRTGGKPGFLLLFLATLLKRRHPLLAF